MQEDAPWGYDPQYTTQYTPQHDQPTDQPTDRHTDRMHKAGLDEATPVDTFMHLNGNTIFITGEDYDC